MFKKIMERQLSTKEKKHALPFTCILKSYKMKMIIKEIIIFLEIKKKVC